MLHAISIAFTSDGARTPSRTLTLNFELELRRKILKGAGIFPKLESRNSRGASTKHGVDPHAMASRSGFMVGPILVAMSVTLSGGSMLP